MTTSLTIDEPPSKIGSAIDALKNLKDHLARKVFETADSKLFEDSREEVKHIDILECKEIKILEGHVSKIYSFDWSNNGKLVSASQDGKMLIWNGKTGHKEHVINLRSSWIMSCAYSKYNESIVGSCGLDNIASIYHLADREHPEPIPRAMIGHSGYVSSLKFMSAKTVATSSGDTTCAIWDIETANPIRIFSQGGHESDVMDLDPMPDQKSFISVGCDAVPILWDPRAPAAQARFDGHTMDCNVVKTLQNGKSFITGSDDTTCKLFDLRTIGAVATYSNPTMGSAITTLDRSISGRFIVVGYDDCSCAIYDVLTGALCGNLPHDDRVSAIRFSPDGLCLGTSSWDGNIRLFVTE